MSYHPISYDKPFTHNEPFPYNDPIPYSQAFPYNEPIPYDEYDESMNQFRLLNRSCTIASRNGKSMVVSELIQDLEPRHEKVMIRYNIRCKSTSGLVLVSQY